MLHSENIAKKSLTIWSPGSQPCSTFITWNTEWIQRVHLHKTITISNRCNSTTYCNYCK